MQKFLLALLSLTLFLCADHEGIPLHGFLDVRADYAKDTDKSEFVVNNLDFYLSKRISERVTVLAELIFENDGSTLVTDLERAQISYEFSESFDVTAGRFHTPFGYWNSAFNHGSQIQTSILRPKFISFEDEGGLLPSHSTGVTFSGSISDWEYSFYVTNGSDIESSPENNSSSLSYGELTPHPASDENKNKQLGFNTSYSSDTLKIGLHALTQDVLIFNGRASQLLMYGAYAFYEDDSFEVIAESYFFSNENKTGSNAGNVYNSSAWFVQVAYLASTVTPYMRVESTNLAQEDVYFLSQRETTGNAYDRFALGMRYDVDHSTAFKLAYIYTQEDLLPSTYHIMTQLSIYF